MERSFLRDLILTEGGLTVLFVLPAVVTFFLISAIQSI
jgi:hypothetical protein